MCRPQYIGNHASNLWTCLGKPTAHQDTPASRSSSVTYHETMPLPLLLLFAGRLITPHEPLQPYRTFLRPMLIGVPSRHRLLMQGVLIFRHHHRPLIQGVIILRTRCRPSSQSCPPPPRPVPPVASPNFQNQNLQTMKDPRASVIIPGVTNLTRPHQRLLLMPLILRSCPAHRQPGSLHVLPATRRLPRLRQASPPVTVFFVQTPAGENQANPPVHHECSPENSQNSKRTWFF